MAPSAVVSLRFSYENCCLLISSMIPEAKLNGFVVPPGHIPTNRRNLFQPSFVKTALGMFLVYRVSKNENCQYRVVGRLS